MESENNNMFMNELNCSNFFINSIDQNDPFESALSSMVSSPVNSNAARNHHENSSENIVLKELIGKLGSIYNNSGGELLSPHSYIVGNNNKSTNTSCYNTPLNSPPKLDLENQFRGNLPFPGNHSSLSPLLSTDPGFADRAARFSCFANKSLGGLNGLAPKLESGKLSRVSSYLSGSQTNVEENKDGDGNSVADQKKFTRLSRSSTPENAEFGDSRENSSVSQQISGVNGQNDVNSRKRKSISKGKGKDIPSSTSTKDANAASENNESSAKRSKSKETEKSAEAPKDYIHVRARRGQATDAHSLAERVRREKISQRMKFLQDLVPGCNKVTGKAVMLDEIINYVQSLQRQVEFLSMKLATINPRMDVNIEALMPKDMFQSSGSLVHGTFASDTSVSAFPFQFHSQQVTDLHNSIPNGTEMHLSMNHMNAACEAASQASTFWEDDLQSVVFGQNQTQNVHDGAISKSQMKIEL